ncbi:MAG: efflux RND transporter periplasmic adaptor subunit [Candidatus Didemnitutus sp.]|nr:efflux RND transporter periplasmic adaptor subunit [Candidatus Didemnitutus sp.]
MKKILWLILVLGGAGGGWYYYSQQGLANAVPVIATTAATRADILQVVSATGQLDPVLSVDVGSQISGLVKKLYVDFNSPVKKGDKLAEIDPATYQQRLRQAEANLAASEASANLQRLNTTRVRSLFDQKLVTQQELDQSLSLLQQSESQLLTSRASVENARVDLERCTINSPIDGIVMNKLTEEGKTVAASLNSPVLFTIANDLSKMQIGASVAEADIGAVTVGQQVTFTVDAFPGRSFRGEVVQVRNAPKTANNVVTYETIINVNNRDLRLRPGMTANVSIIVARRDGVVRIPNSVLRVRIPEGVTVAGVAPKAAPAAKDAPAAPATDSAPRGEGRRGGGGGGGMFGDLSSEQRQVLRAIMTEVGVDFRSGPPTAEQRAQIEKMAHERGITLGESARPGEVTVTTRTVYRQKSPTAPIETVTIKAGITDGSGTEVIEGLAEGDLLITSITLPGARPAQGTNNPFGGQRRF